MPDSSSIRPRLHCNIAGGARLSPPVAEAMERHIRVEALLGSVEAAESALKELNGIYLALGQLAGVGADRIFLGSSNTDCWARTFAAVDIHEGDVVLLGENEWGGNLSAIAHRCTETGARMQVLASDGRGAIDPERLAKALSARVRAVCVTHAPAQNGLVSPVDEICDALSGHPAWLFVDMAQSFGNVTWTLPNPRVDVATASGRKFLGGPRGTGFAILSRRFLDGPLPLSVDQFSAPWIGETPVLRTDARCYEFAESSMAARLGLKAAVDATLARDGGAVLSRIARNAALIRDELARLPEVELIDAGAPLSGIVTFRHMSLTPGEVRARLAKAGFSVAAPPAHYAPIWHANGRPLCVRLSVDASAADADIVGLAAAVKAI